MKFDWGAGDQIVCIDAMGPDSYKLERGKVYTCHEIWRCNKDILVTLEDVFYTKDFLPPIVWVALNSGMAICPDCMKPADTRIIYEAWRFIKVPGEKERDDMKVEDRPIMKDTTNAS